jgi:hypothetical protein
MRHALAIALALAGCGSEAGPVRDGAAIDIAFPNPVDLPQGGGGCVLQLEQAGSDGSCLFEWTCLDGGTLELACGPVDGGAQCLCGQEGQPPLIVDQAPAACAPPEVTQFARDRCGWSGL